MNKKETLKLNQKLDEYEILNECNTEISLPYTANNGDINVKLTFSNGVNNSLKGINRIGGVNTEHWTDVQYSNFTDHSIENVVLNNKDCLKSIYNSNGDYTSGYHVITSKNSDGVVYNHTHKYFIYLEVFVESVLGANTKIIDSMNTVDTSYLNTMVKLNSQLNINNHTTWQTLAVVGSPADYNTNQINLRIQNDGVIYIANPVFIDLTLNELETKTFDELKTMAQNGDFNDSGNTDMFSAIINNGSKSIVIEPFVNKTITKTLTVTNGSTLTISRNGGYSTANVSTFIKGTDIPKVQDCQLVINTRFRGATVVFEGDSITDSDFSESYGGKSWADYLSSKLQFGTVVNPSLGGSTISNTHANEGGQVVTRITNTNYPSDTKLFFLFAGTNDWNNNVALGTTDSTDSSTILGALNNCIDAIQTKLPEATIVVMTPMHRSGTRTATRTAGTMMDVAKGYEAVCERWGVDCVNTLKTFGINAYNSNVATKYYIETEGQLHPLPDGHKRIAVRMAGIISTI